MEEITVFTLCLAFAAAAAVGFGLASFITGSREQLSGLEGSEVLDALPDGVVVVDPDGRIRAANRAFRELADVPDEAWRGQPIRERIRGAEVARAGADGFAEGELVTGDGGALPVLVLRTSVASMPRAGSEQVIIVRDLREVEALRGRLVTSGRLATVGELAAGIAREIQAPLAELSKHLDELGSAWGELAPAVARAGDEGDALWVEEGDEILAESLEGVLRAASISTDVQGFSQAGGGERQRADVNALLDGVLRVLTPQLRSVGRVHKDYGQVPPVRCAPQELQQVFLNLVQNASHAVEPGGDIRLETRCGDGCVRVHVSDAGCGIAEPDLERIFDPFFTTKPVGEGTGLGLAISHEIVRKHGGELRVSSRPGEGSTFTVELPADAPAEPGPVR
ncbi:MAG: ATP-binding protein [Proteobacteria bacterium]|nr:ATP-binding protein [Pseudomonadota bacterium]